MARVLVESPPFPMAIVADVLTGCGVAIEARGTEETGADVVGLLGWQPVVAADFARYPALKVIACCGVGFDQVDLAQARRQGVWVCNVPDYCVEEMADTTIALLLALVRGIIVLDRSVRAGQWDDHAAGPLQRLRGTSLGVVGFGRIGRAVARRALGLGFDVGAADPQVGAAEISDLGARPLPLDELLATSAAVTLHVPLTEQTRGMIGARELALMRPGSYLINTARAGLLDWPAFLQALRHGPLAGAAVDVLPVEPPTTGEPAPRDDNLIVTPHAAWYSEEAEQQVYRRAALAVRAVLEGRIPDGAVVIPDPARARR